MLKKKRVLDLNQKQKKKEFLRVKFINVKQSLSTKQKQSPLSKNLSRKKEKNKEKKNY